MNPPNAWVEALKVVWPGIIALVVLYLGHWSNVERERRSKVMEARLRRRHRWEEFDEKAILELQEKLPRIAYFTQKMLGETVQMTAKPPDSMTPIIGPASLPEFGESQDIIFNLSTRIRD